MIQRFLLLSLALLLSFSHCLPAAAQEGGSIDLYGEFHANPSILERELELWNACYHQDGMRHLFIELPYYTGEFLNLWMQSDDDILLDQVYNDWAGSASYSTYVKFFYQAIKEQCPETVFHGTDVGHQYQTTGARYLALLESQGMQDSESYALALENIEQGKQFYRSGEDVYRENQMVANFIRAYESLEDADVMGIYGSAHTHLNALDYSGQVENMATQLAARYGERLHSKDLSHIEKEGKEPLATETIAVNGKEYTALYFGSESTASFSDVYQSRAFYRLEDAYADFRDCPTVENVLPYSNYPMSVSTGQVFVIDYTRYDGTIERQYYRDDGDIWHGDSTTIQFIPE